MRMFPIHTGRRCKCADETKVEVCMCACVCRVYYNVSHLVGD